MLITFVNSLDPDQDQQNVIPDLEPNLLTLIVFLKKKIENKKNLINFFKKFLHKHYHSVKWFWAGPPFCRSWSGSKLFAKIICRWAKVAVSPDLGPNCLQSLSADGQKLLSVLIWVQTVFKGYRQTTKVAASKERIEHLAKNLLFKGC